jgi:hypothetical protein
VREDIAERVEVGAVGSSKLRSLPIADGGRGDVFGASAGSSAEDTVPRESVGFPEVRCVRTGARQRPGRRGANRRATGFLRVFRRIRFPKTSRIGRTRTASCGSPTVGRRRLPACSLRSEVERSPVCRQLRQGTCVGAQAAPGAETASEWSPVPQQRGAWHTVQETSTVEPVRRKRLQTTWQELYQLSVTTSRGVRATALDSLK